MLDETRNEPGYVLGRILAVCQAAMQEARMVPEGLPDTAHASLPQHFVRVMGRFIAALKVLRGEHQTDRVEFYENKMQELMRLVDPDVNWAFADADGLVPIGFWHQRAALKA